MSTFDLKNFNIKEFDAVLACGLSQGLGQSDGQMCIEAAICKVLGMDHGDDPGCVAKSVRSFKISLNDKVWSSPQARADGLRDLGLAQLGSLGTIDDKQFVTKLAERLIRVLVPTLIRDLYPTNDKLLAAADRCEVEGPRYSALAARGLLRAADAAAAAAVAAADAAADAAVDARDKYLKLGAKIALDVLIEMKSPGVELLGASK